MKKAKFLLALMCLLSLSGCGMAANTGDAQMMENTVSVNFDDVASLRNLNEQYCDHLGQATEKEFMAEEGIASADATVAYDEGTGQYSVELSIETNGEVSEEQIANSARTA